MATCRGDATWGGIQLRFLTAAASSSIPSSPVVAAAVALALILASHPIVRRLARREGDPRLASLLWLSLALHLAAAPLLIFIDNHVYHGVTDYTGYDLQGARLAGNIHSGYFTLSGTGIDGIVGDGMVSIVAGSVFTIVGVNQLAGFLVFSWFSFLGLIGFYRAYCITFPAVAHRRYALLLFLLPTLVYWPSAISKEALMMLAVGVASYGAARALVGEPRGYAWLALGIAIGAGVRPNEVLLLVFAFVIAVAIRGRDRLRTMQPLQLLSSVAFLAGALALSIVMTTKFLHGNGTSVGSVLHTVNANNRAGSGAGFGSSTVSYSGSPAAYPKDVYTVLFDPLPFQAHNLTQLIAAVENSMIVIIVLASWRQLAAVPRASVARPYVLLSLIYTAGFLYVFASLGNLGLIERERVLVLPFLLVLLCIPVARPGKRFDWERSRRERRKAEVATAA